MTAITLFETAPKTYFVAVDTTDQDKAIEIFESCSAWLYNGIFKDIANGREQTMFAIQNDDQEVLIEDFEL